MKAAHPDAPVIGYPRGAGLAYRRFAEETGVDAVSIDSTVPPDWAAGTCSRDARCRATSILRRWWRGARRCTVPANAILDALGHGPFVFNLGEGVVPQTPPDHVAALCDIVHAWQGGGRDEPRRGGPVQSRRAGFARCRRALPAQPVPRSGDHPGARAAPPPDRPADRAPARRPKRGTSIARSAAARPCCRKPRRRRPRWPRPWTISARSPSPSPCATGTP